jgi:4-hydroxybenzoate polyprenyltransferase
MAVSQKRTVYSDEKNKSLYDAIHLLRHYNYSDDELAETKQLTLMSIEEQNNYPFLRRFFIYQKERFPFLGHGLLVASFSFSAISYSRICRGTEGFVSWSTFLVGIVTTISLFFLVRVFDEFKDAEDDVKHRSYLPVPRGLISFKELAIMGVLAVIVQIGLNALFFPKMLLLYSIAMGYLCLMGREFFIGEWLKKHQLWYVVSHMLIIPLIDMYASGLDWLLEGVNAPKGLIFFFIVSFMNGIVLEIGRKIRVPEKEEFNTYSKMFGAVKATGLWILILFVTLCFSILASSFAGHGITGIAILVCLFILCVIPALLFLSKQSQHGSKLIEYASALWTIGMYLTLGGVPMLNQLLHL